VDGLSIVFWQDRYVPFVVALTMTEMEMRRSVTTVAKHMVSVSGTLLGRAFGPFISDCPKLFEGLLRRLLAVMRGRKHDQVTDELVTMLCAQKVSVSPRLAQKAIWRSDKSHLLAFHVGPDVVPKEAFLVPHPVNDTLFGLYRKTLVPAQAAAVALTFLNEYEAARICYSPATPFLTVMESVNNRFLPEFGSAADLLRPLAFRASAPIARAFDAAIAVGQSEDPLAVAARAEGIRNLNIELLAKRKTVTPFEKERAAAIETMCRIMVGEHDHSLDYTCTNPGFLKMLKLFQRFLTRATPPQDCAIVGGPASIVLAPTALAQFREICTRTSRGLVAVNTEQLNAYFLDSVANAREWHHLAAFTHNAFLASPAPELFNSAFAASCRVLTQGFSLDAAARIIALARVALATDISRFSETLELHRDVFVRERADLELMTQLDSFACHIFEAMTSADPPRLVQIVDKAVSGLNQRLSATFATRTQGPACPRRPRKGFHTLPRGCGREG
jgi:hypothetical protein